jgi:N-6 DNA Methylase
MHGRRRGYHALSARLRELVYERLLVRQTFALSPFFFCSNGDIAIVPTSLIVDTSSGRSLLGTASELRVTDPTRHSVRSRGCQCLRKVRAKYLDPRIPSGAAYPSATACDKFSSNVGLQCGLIALSNIGLVQKLWGLCNILRDDGITFHQYVNELSFLLFLKMAQEIDAEGDIPVGYRWNDLARLKGGDQFDFYRRQLVILGTAGTANVRTIFANPTSLLRHAESLSALVAKIDELDWYSAKREGLGELYEGLLEKNASEKKSGAGQYFTPRPLIEAIVEVMQPLTNEVILDPAAGTGGFLVVANDYAKK